MNQSSNVSINDVCRVARSNGVYYLATIIESRTTESGELEYFVHYKHQDRRLDEWITRDRIDTSGRTCKMFKPEDGNLDPLELSGRCTRNQKRMAAIICPSSPQHSLPGSLDSSTQKLEMEHQEFTRVKFIDRIQFGKYEIDTWYFSPYPEEYRRLSKLWICEYCLKYMKSASTWLDHVTHLCKETNPPGKVIYKKGSLSVYELDGQEQKLYCQNLCLLAKLFLDHKTLYYDVAPFMFYVLCETDREGCHVVGYFSKEKVSADNYNLACILTLPPFQKRGIGRFLISLSYELTKIECVIGTPEKPLSDLGRLSYQSYWEDVIFRYLHQKPNASLDELSSETFIAKEDILWTLCYQKHVKLWRSGKSAFIRSDELVRRLKQVTQDAKKHQKVMPSVGAPTGRPSLRAQRRSSAPTSNVSGSSFVEFDPTCLTWSPSSDRSVYAKLRP